MEVYKGKEWTYNNIKTTPHCVPAHCGVKITTQPQYVWKLSSAHFEVHIPVTFWLAVLLLEVCGMFWFGSEHS